MTEIDIKRLKADPVYFGETVFGIETFEKQREFLRSVVDHKYISVRAGNKVSKTFSLSVISWWWLLTKKNSRVVWIGPVESTIERGTWKEFKDLYSRIKFPINDVTINKSASGGIQFQDGRDAFCRTTAQPSNIQGLSARGNLLICVDEATGIDNPEIFEAIMRNLAGGGKIILISNPITTSGPFYDSHHSQRDKWHCIHMSAFDSPNVIHNKTIIPGLAEKEWIDDMRDMYGEKHPIYTVGVLGDFPVEGDDTLISLLDIENAFKRKPELDYPNNDIYIGCDVARYGKDYSVITAIDNNKLIDIEAYNGLDLVTLCQKINTMAMNMSAKVVAIDSCGIGAGVYDILSKYENKKYLVVGINVAERSRYPEKYYRLRDELYFSLQDWVKQSIIPKNHKYSPKLSAELIIPKYSVAINLSLKVESKDEMKVRLGRSPDFLESLMLAVYAQRNYQGNNSSRDFIELNSFVEEVRKYKDNNDGWDD